MIRGHHVYRDIWTPVKDETVLCMEDDSWTPRLSIYGHQLKMKQSFVWKMIRGHHVYRDIWTPVKDETVLCMEDDSWTSRLSRYMDTS